jgi:hypothetical protein
MSYPSLRRALAALVLLSLTACGPKLVRERVFEGAQTRVELQRREKSGEVVPRGFAHPATIADVRIAHILASLVFEDGSKKKRAVIRSEHVFELAEGIAAALAKATPDDEVAAAAFPRDRKLAIFTDDRVTAFRLHLEGDAMLIQFMNVEDALEKEGAKVGYSEYEIPGDVGSLKPSFTLEKGDSITPAGNRGVSVAWRDDVFRRPVSLRDRDGKTKRRTVLMELPPEKGAEGEPAAAPRPPGLVDDQLRALDQLDADRSAGKVTEADYQRKRRLILEDKLEDAGYERTKK